MESMECRSPNAYQEVSNTNHFGSVSDSLGRLSDSLGRLSDSLGRLAAASQCMDSLKVQPRGSSLCQHLGSRTHSCVGSERSPPGLTIGI